MPLRVCLDQSHIEIFNCEVLFREDCPTEEFIDVIVGNRIYMPCIYVSITFMILNVALMFVYIAALLYKVYCHMLHSLFSNSDVGFVENDGLMCHKK